MDKYNFKSREPHYSWGTVLEFQKPVIKGKFIWVIEH